MRSGFDYVTGSYFQNKIILTKIVITNRMSEMVAKDLISATEKLQKLLPLVLVNNLVIEGKLYSIYFCNTAMLM